MAKTVNKTKKRIIISFTVLLALFFALFLRLSFLMLVMLESACFWVSFKYEMSAPQAPIHSFSPSILNVSKETTPNCFCKVFVAICRLNSLSVKAKNGGRTPCFTKGDSLKISSALDEEIISTGLTLTKTSVSSSKADSPLKFLTKNSKK